MPRRAVNYLLEIIGKNKANTWRENEKKKRKSGLFLFLTTEMGCGVERGWLQDFDPRPTVAAARCPGVCKSKAKAAGTVNNRTATQIYMNIVLASMAGPTSPWRTLAI